MNDPLNGIEITLSRKSFGQPPQRRQHTFSAPVDLRELHDQRAGAQSDLCEDLRGACAEDDRTNGNQGGDVLVRERKYFVRGQTFDQYPF